MDPWQGSIELYVVCKKKQVIYSPPAWQASRSTIGLNKVTLQPLISMGQNNTKEQGKRNKETGNDQALLVLLKYWEPGVKMSQLKEPLGWVGQRIWLERCAQNLLMPQDLGPNMVEFMPDT